MGNGNIACSVCGYFCLVKVFNLDCAIENLLQLLPKAFGKNFITISTAKSGFNLVK